MTKLGSAGGNRNDVHMAISNEPGFTFTDVDEHPQQSKWLLKKQETVTKPRSTHPTEHPQPLAVFAMVRSPLLTLSGWGFQHPMAEILMV